MGACIVTQLTVKGALGGTPSASLAVSQLTSTPPSTQLQSRCEVYPLRASANGAPESGTVSIISADPRTGKNWDFTFGFAKMVSSGGSFHLARSALLRF